MKRWFWILLLCVLMMTGAAALAEIPESDTTTPRLGVAVAAPVNMGGLVPMFDKPDPEGNVLMNYFSGAQLEVVGFSKEGMVQVQAGEKGASIMGYMKETDLRYGAQAVREVQPYVIDLNFQESVPIYAYCDGQAAVLGETGVMMTRLAMGYNEEGWLQVFNAYAGQELCGGFIPDNYSVLKELPKARASWLVEPLEGELTQAEAIERALSYLLEHPELDAMQKLPESLRSREGLESMSMLVRLTYSRNTESAVWEVDLQSREDCEENVSVILTPQGEVIRAERGNG